MYARIRQKIAMNYTTTVVSNGSGTRAMSVLMKDIAKLICGSITSTSQLHPDIWDVNNSEIISGTAGGWSEYQSNYTQTSTDIPISTNSNANMIYLRTRSSTGTFKYLGLGFTANVNSAGNVFWNFIYPWHVNDFIGNPTLAFRENASNTTYSNSIRNPFFTDAAYEYIIYSSPRAVVVSARNVSSSILVCYKICSFLEYPSTPLSTPFNLPNQVWWEVSSSSISTTGTGSTRISNGYKITGGFNPQIVGAANQYSDYVTSFQSGGNFAVVYSAYDVSVGNTSLWPAPSTNTLSTLKPDAFGSMSSAISSTGASLTIPVMPLVHYPAWDTCYDLSSLTGVYATRPNMGANGDTLKVNGQNYSYVNCTTMSYLVPRS